MGPALAQRRSVGTSIGVALLIHQNTSESCTQKHRIGSTKINVHLIQYLPSALAPGHAHLDHPGRRQ